MASFRLFQDRENGDVFLVFTLFTYLFIYLFTPVPEQPTNLQGESNSPNSIQLTWDPPEDSGESIQSYELYYNDSHFRQNVRITISPPRNTYLLEDLTPNTVYHIRVAARSLRGEGASTPTIQVRTLEYGKLLLYTTTTTL